MPRRVEPCCDLGDWAALAYALRDDEDERARELGEWVDRILSHAAQRPPPGELAGSIRQAVGGVRRLVSGIDQKGGPRGSAGNRGRVAAAWGALRTIVACARVTQELLQQVGLIQYARRGGSSKRVEGIAADRIAVEVVAKGGTRRALTTSGIDARAVGAGTTERAVFRAVARMKDRLMSPEEARAIRSASGPGLVFVGTVVADADGSHRVVPDRDLDESAAGGTKVSD